MDEEKLKLSVIHGNIQHQTAQLRQGSEMLTSVKKAAPTVPSLVITTCNTWLVHLVDKINSPLHFAHFSTGQLIVC